jgi:hypothetical protein
MIGKRFFVFPQEQSISRLRKNVKKTGIKTGGTVGMVEAVITEHAGTRKGPITGFYQYSREGIRGLDSGKTLKRLYIFGPSADMMTEHDIALHGKILRRFMFDQNGMLEETFSFGQRPRTFRYESGGKQIAVREGGQYGAVSKIFTFDRNGITETAWGREGEIERVYIFDEGNDAITERAAGWFGPVTRTMVFEGIDASVFREPEAFLQFIMFTEHREGEADATGNVEPDSTHETGSSPPRSRFAFTGKRHLPSDSDKDTGENEGDTRIDFIPDGDSPADEILNEKPRRKKER